MTQHIVWHAWVHGKKERYIGACHVCYPWALILAWMLCQVKLKLLHRHIIILAVSLKELAEQRVMVVSGHHGTIHVDELRLIIDEGGGLSHLPVTAIILPSREMVRDTDKSNEAASSC